MNWPFGLYGSGVHQFILDEMELGTRVALALDDEQYSECPEWFMAFYPLEEYYGKND